MTKLKFAKIAALALVIGILYFNVTANAQPGTPEDPLVSRSYVNNRIAELEARIAQMTIPVGDPVQAPIQTPSQAVERELFRVVRVYTGTILIGGASTEIILRSGEATVVAGQNGLANVTAGHDIMNGHAVPHNHLLIVPQADGRGLRFHTVAYLMVKGDFHLIDG